jgi:hypothetical protein
VLSTASTHSLPAANDTLVLVTLPAPSALPKPAAIMTGKYEFQSTLHRTSRDMHRHMAKAYMLECGLNDAEAVHLFFKTFTNEMIADGAERKWGLSSNPDYDRAQFMETMNSLREAAKFVERWIRR